MATTFDGLETTVDLMMTGNRDVLAKMSENDVVNLNKTVAKLELKQDLIQLNGIDSLDENNLLDEIVVYNENYLQRVLSYKQLALYYLENNDGDGSQSFERFKYYDKRYSDENNKLSGLLIKETNIVTSNRISLG